MVGGRTRGTTDGIVAGLVTQMCNRRSARARSHANTQPTPVQLQKEVEGEGQRSRTPPPGLVGSWTVTTV